MNRMDSNRDWGNSDYGYSTVKTNGALELRTFNLAIGAILAWGFLVNAVMVKTCYDFFAQFNLWAILIGYFVCCIVGICMSKFSDNPLISFIGYNLVVVPIGVVLCLSLKDVESASIMHAALVTGGVTILMIAMACIWPDFFLGLGRVLFGALSAVVIIEISLLIWGKYTPSAWDWMVALLFAGYIGYDWAKAQNTDHTLDDAVDACVDLYLDIINLFIRILSASEKSSSRSRK